MSTYNEMFKLSLKDVDLIERAVRQQIAYLSRLDSSAQYEESDAADNHKKIVELIHLLGNLHNQKTGYGQKLHAGVPLS